MGGGGGQNKTTVEIPESLETGAQASLSGALQAAGIGYRPNRGVSVAAFAPQQAAAFEGANRAAEAAGFGPSPGAMSYLPAFQQAGGGFIGYSTSPVLDANVEASMTPADLRQREAALRYFTRAGRETNDELIPYEGQVSPIYQSGEETAGDVSGYRGGYALEQGFGSPLVQQAIRDEVAQQVQRQNQASASPYITGSYNLPGERWQRNRGGRR